MSPPGRPRGECRSGPRLALSVQYAVSEARLPTRAKLRRWILAALAGHAGAAVVTARFVGRREGLRLNAQFRGGDHPTNVLTFVYDDTEPLCGDLVLCVPVLRGEAREQRKEPADHCAHLVVHGMLHLQGLDHRTARAARLMETRETAILAGLGIPDPYATPYAGRPLR